MELALVVVETMCMKGLLLSCLEKKEDAYELARKGLKADLRSHVCWHVLGLIYRSDRNYAESSKCYKSALRMDPGNQQIMRDLCLLQLHERDFLGYSETRRQLLAGKAGQRQSWISFAVAEHLRGEVQSALDVLRKMDESFGISEDPLGRYEKSELQLYRAGLLMEAGKLDEAIEAYHSDVIVDRVTKLEHLVCIHFGRSDMIQCKRSLKELVTLNSSHEGYLLVLLAVYGVLPDTCAEQVRRWLSLADSSCKDKPALKRERIQIGNKKIKVSPTSLGIVFKNFKSALSPSDLLASLADIKDETQCDSFALLALFLLPADSPEFRAKLASFVEAKLSKGVPSTFKLLRDLYVQSATKGQMVKAVLDALCSENAPILSTFAYLSLAQHFDFQGEFLEAMKAVEAGIALTPTLTDLYVLKAKIEKHSGQFLASSATLEFARKLDLADRYLNSKSVKALLRVDEIEKAREVIMLFAKDSADATKSNLKEMQCMWWELELGKAYARKGQLANALSAWSDTRKHFADMAEDEFDFNFYCARKMTLRSYIEFLKFEDGLLAQKAFQRVAKEWVAVWMQVARGSGGNEAKKSSSKKSGDDFIAGKDPIVEASGIIKELLGKAPQWKGTHKLAFEVNLQKRDFALCLRDLKKLRELGSSKVPGLAASLAAAGCDETIKQELHALSN